MTIQSFESGQAPLATPPLRVRWLGTVPYREALAVQTSLFEHGVGQHLLLLEHPHVFTYGRTANLATNLRCEPAAVGAELVAAKRGGDITYHGPGQLVGYPILNVDNKLGATGHVCGVEGLIIDALTELGVPNAGRLDGYAGVWLDAGTERERKICAIGVRLKQGRTMHGFALNVSTDLTFMREHIVPCGIGDKPVTSLVEEGIGASLEQVADVVARLAAQRWADGVAERQDVAWRHAADGRDLTAFSRGEGPGEQVKLVSQRAAARLEDAGVDGIAVNDVAHAGSGAWRATPSEDTNNDGFDKFELYVGPEAPYMDLLVGVTIADIETISFSTHKSGSEGSPDFYVVIYTAPNGVDDNGWYGHRLIGEPLYSRGLDAPADQWNTWTTSEGPNQLIFNDSDLSGSLGFYTAPTLAELQGNAAYDWSQAFGSGAVTAVDYGAEQLHYLSIQTGSPWESEFNGAIDSIELVLTNGNRLAVDLEP